MHSTKQTAAAAEAMWIVCVIVDSSEGWQLMRVY